MNKQLIPIMYNTIKTNKFENIQPMSQIVNSQTRTKCQIGLFRVSNPGYKDVFVKLSPCLDESDHHVTDLRKAKTSITSVEVELFGMTNLLRKHGVCNTFVESYTTDLLKISHFKYGDHCYSMLITEPIKGTTFDNFLKSKKYSLSLTEYAEILFQLIYAIDCLNHIKMKHMDLHFENIFIEELREPIVIKYGLIHKDVYVKTKYIVKIIDLDGAYKLNGSEYLKEDFKRAIQNKEIFSGKSDKMNNRMDLIKIVFHLTHYFPKNVLKELHLTDVHDRVPFINTKLKNILKSANYKFRNTYYTNKFGIFLNKKMNPLSLDENSIRSSFIILDDLSNSFFSKKITKISKSYDQKKLFSTFSSVVLSP